MMLNSTKPDSDKTRKKGNNPRKTGAEAGITVESQPENNQETPLEKSSKDDDPHDFSDPILDLFQCHWDEEEDLQVILEIVNDPHPKMYSSYI